MRYSREKGNREFIFLVFFKRHLVVEFFYISSCQTIKMNTFVLFRFFFNDFALIAASRRGGSKVTSLMIFHWWRHRLFFIWWHCQWFCDDDIVNDFSIKTPLMIIHLITTVMIFHLITSLLIYHWWRHLSIFIDDVTDQLPLDIGS